MAIAVLAYSNSGQYSVWVLAAILFILAEPHFAITIPLVNFSERKNFKAKVFGDEYDWGTLFVKLPLFSILIFLILALISFEIATLLFFFINFFHVNRQSSGILKLALRRGGQTNPSRKEDYFVWITSIICISFFSLKMAGIEISRNQQLFAIASHLFLTGVFTYWYIKDHQNFKDIILALWTSALMWTPAFFYEDVLPVLLLGVSMHYTQYLYLGFRVLKGQRNDPSFKLKRSPALILIWLVSASTVLTIAAIFEFDHRFFIIFPMCFQLYHFIVDAFLWRASTQEVRTNIMRHVF